MPGDEEIERRRRMRVDVEDVQVLVELIDDRRAHHGRGYRPLRLEPDEERALFRLRTAALRRVKMPRP